ncbi:malate synthase A [Virgibacillus sp. L01]|uniref:malate synthase A n=1 Tax=Virgibacillus sp. L01 TaxID=3457429 RepID=UPI003FD29B32
MLTKNEKVRINNHLGDKFDEVLTDDALNFIAKLHIHFEERRKRLLELRNELQNGQQELDFLPETKDIRESEWTIDQLPTDLQDRRVEITGPVDRKMVINALNSGAKTFMADFEDATSPTWENVVNGQINLKDAIRKKIDFQGDNGKEYKLNDSTAVLMVRPRGWHLEEQNLTINGNPVSASFVDFGLYFFHNAKELLRRGSGPYFYLPKLENHLEARLWNDVFVFAQNELVIPQGSIKATVLIETINAAFEMDEILYELREHSAGLNCGRWDYIFSFIKKFQSNPDVLFPDRSTVTMDVPFMHAYSLLAIKTCHQRNAPAIGGMAAQIPVKNDPKANEASFQKVRADKEREVTDGHDGTWVAHPGMVQFVKDIFDKRMPESNQISRKREDVVVSREDLLEVPQGKITEQGVRTNITVGIQYIAAWLQGRGAVPINHLMEDAATAEISRAQLWQWIRHPNGVLEDQRKVTLKIIDKIVQEEFEDEKYKEASSLFRDLIVRDDFAEFLTIPAYKQLMKGEINNGK